MGPSNGKGRKLTVQERRFLQNLDDVDPDRHMFGPLARWDASELIALRDIDVVIAGGLANKSGRGCVVLVGGPAGSGKTQLVRWSAATHHARLIEIGLSSANQGDVECRLAALPRDGARRVVLLDECDTKPWACQALLQPIDVAARRKRGRTVFALLGSTGNHVDGLKRSLRNQFRGPDLVSRTTSQHTIPPLSFQDRVIIFLVTLAGLVPRRTGALYVEKLALAWVLADPALELGRDIARAATDVAVQAGGATITYDLMVARERTIAKHYFAALHRGFSAKWVSVRSTALRAGA
jgi:hypothetical protein